MFQVPYFAVCNVHLCFSTNCTWELVLPMRNVHPYSSLKNLGKKGHIIGGKI